MDRSILIVVPSYDGNIRPEVSESIKNLALPVGYKMDLQIITRMLIHSARNKAVKQMLEGGYDYLLMCDDDNAPVDNNALQLLLDANVDIISGCIRQRSKPNKLAIYKKVVGDGFGGFEQLDILPDSKKPVVSVHNVGTGFVLYKRDFLLHINNVYGLPFESKLSHFVKIKGIWYEIEKSLRAIGIQDIPGMVRRELSEDLLFHRRAKRLGYSIHIHKQVLLNHYSPTDIYSV